MSALPVVTAAIGTALAGFLALSLAMDRHYEDSYGRGSQPGSARPWLRLAGSATLACSLVLSLCLQGMAQGWVLWLGVLTLAAVAATLLLSYLPRHIARVGLGAGAVALLALLAALAGF